MTSVCCMHPTKAAHWLCPKCQQMFCSDCITKIDGGSLGSKKIVRFCPKCQVETEWIGSADIIKPFWERLHKIFLYPLSPGPMIYMAVLAALSLLNWIPYIGALCWGLMMSYSYAALKKTSTGQLAPPPIWDESITKDLPKVFMQLGLFIILFLIFTFIGQTFGPFFALLFVILALFLLPSMIIILVNTQSISTALNPAASLTLPFTIGKGYFIMFLFLTLLLAAPGQLLYWIAPALHPFLYKFVYTLAGNYYTLISYHLMGYVLLQYHKEIGVEISVDDIKDSSAPIQEKADDPATLTLKRIEVLCREGKLDEAIEILEQWRKNGGPLNAPLAERFFDLLKTKQRTEEMLKHSPACLDTIVESGNKNKAIEIYQTCRSVNRQFVGEPKSMFKLGEWLVDAGKPKDAIKALSSMTKAYPTSPDAPMAYFRAAQLYHDRLMDKGRAKTILDQLIEKYPDHQMAQKFKLYLDHIK